MIPLYKKFLVIIYSGIDKENVLSLSIPLFLKNFVFCIAFQKILCYNTGEIVNVNVYIHCKEVQK